MTLAKGLTYLWIAAVGGLLLVWVSDTSIFAPATFEQTLRGWGPWALAAFIVLSLVRGALLVPSTPIVLAGGALFPNALPLVLIISMAGIIVSAWLLYRFPGYAGYDKRLAARYPDRLARLQVHLTRPRALWFVALWAFFPATPTDLVCYAAGLVGMPFRRMMLGVLIGKVPLVSAYLLLGREMAELVPI